MCKPTTPPLDDGRGSNLCTALCRASKAPMAKPGGLSAAGPPQANREATERGTTIASRIAHFLNAPPAPKEKR